MDLRTALGVEHKRQEAEDAVESALQAATEAEVAEAAAAEEAGTERPTAMQRFRALGERIMALADKKDGQRFRGFYGGEMYTGFTEVGVEGVGITLKARESYTPGSLRGRELNYLNVQWESSAYAADTPFAQQEIGLSEVREHNVTPEVWGMLRLMEQSVAVAELARQGEPVTQT
jgi:hypothetical protein